MNTKISVINHKTNQIFSVTANSFKTARRKIRRKLRRNGLSITSASFARSTGLGLTEIYIYTINWNPQGA